MENKGRVDGKESRKGGRKEARKKSPLSSSLMAVP
jgi:hypothetical protein